MCHCDPSIASSPGTKTEAERAGAAMAIEDKQRRAEKRIFAVRWKVCFSCERGRRCYQRREERKKERLVDR